MEARKIRIEQQFNTTVEGDRETYTQKITHNEIYECEESCSQEKNEMNELMTFIAHGIKHSSYVQQLHDKIIT